MRAHPEEGIHMSDKHRSHRPTPRSDPADERTRPPIRSGSSAVDTARSSGATTKFFQTTPTSDVGCCGRPGLGWRAGNRRDGGNTSFEVGGDSRWDCGVRPLISSSG